jgi:hypothetical protein
MAVRTTARTQAFMPGLSPHEVKTAIFFILIGSKRRKNSYKWQKESFSDMNKP